MRAKRTKIFSMTFYFQDSSNLEQNASAARAHPQYRRGANLLDVGLNPVELAGQHRWAYANHREGKARSCPP